MKTYIIGWSFEHCTKQKDWCDCMKIKTMSRKDAIRCYVNTLPHTLNWSQVLHVVEI